MKIKSGFWVVVLVLANFISNAQIRKYSNEFLSIGVGARGLGMGGAQVATTDDVNSIFWNPAGLCGIDNNVQIAAMHSEYFGGIAKYDFVGAAIPMSHGTRNSENKSMLGIGLIRFGVDDIPNTLHLIDANGNINYDNVSSFSAADYALITSYSRELINENRGDKIVRLGGSAKIIHRIVGDFANSWGFGLDAGLQAKFNAVRLGVMLQDASTTFNTWSFNFTDADQAILAQTGNVIPSRSSEITSPKIKLGGAYKFEFAEKFMLLPEAGFDITTDGKRNVLVSASPFSIDPKIGIEAGYNEVVYVRLGVNNIQHQTDDVGNKITTIQPNFGIGLHIGNFFIDYALTSPGSAGNVLYSHVFSLKLDIGKDNSNSRRTAWGGHRYRR